jgi:hypothetical protein
MFLAEIHRELNQNCHPERSGGKRSAVAAQSKDPMLPGVTSGLNRSFHPDSESHPDSHRVGSNSTLAIRVSLTRPGSPNLDLEIRNPGWHDHSPTFADPEEALDLRYEPHNV